MLLRNLPQVHLAMVDRWDEPPPTKKGLYLESGDRFARRPRAVHDGAYSSAIHRTAFAMNRRLVLRRESEEAAREFPDEHFDMIFVDGGHYREQVLLDLESWEPKVRQGGVLSGHDYGGKYLGVTEAVNEFCGKIGARLWRLDGSVWYAQRPYRPNPPPLEFPQWSARLVVGG